MTPEEAIRQLEKMKDDLFSIGYYGDFGKEIFNMAIHALKEVQQYREIGTVEECREAMVKQIPKKPYHEEWIGIDGVPYDLCPNPNCRKNIYTTSSKISYCEHCGQAITWDKSSDTVGNKN